MGKITITCTQCHKKFEEPLSSLDTDREFRCPFCNILFKFKGPGVEASVKKALDDFKRKLRR